MYAQRIFRPEDSDNSAYVRVPAMSYGDQEITISIWECGDDRSDTGVRTLYAYVVRCDGSTVLRGADLCGPATGRIPKAWKMALTLASFLGATWEMGELTEHGRNYTPAEQAWLETHAERFAAWSADAD